MDGQDATQAKDTSLSRIGPDYFKTLQIPLLRGRDFDARDRVETPKVAIVNEAFSREFLNGENPVGQRFWIAATPGEPDTPYEIVGMVGNTKYESLREEFVLRERLLATLSFFFGLLALLLACIGLYGILFWRCQPDKRDWDSRRWGLERAMCSG
jgi:hypothetical protein